MNIVLDSMRGCLLGGAAGDALGYPVEFMSWSSIRKTYGEAGIRQYSADRRQGLALISDDTQMTFFTVCGLLDALDAEPDGFDGLVPALYGAYLNWFGTQTGKYPANPAGPVSQILARPELHALRAPGNTCLSALASGRMGSVEAPVNHSKGCGGVMRTAPIGLLLPDAGGDLLLRLDRLGAEAAATTHGHPLGYIPAAFLTHAVHEAAYHKEKALRAVVAEALEATGELFAGTAELRCFQALIGRAAALAEQPGKDAEHIHALGGGWDGDEAAAIAVYCALRYEKDFSGGLIAAVNHSGDSDSTGSVTGQLLGARAGYDAVAGRWLKGLELADLALELAGELARRVCR